MENDLCKKNTTAPDTSVGADDGQPLYNSTENSIPVFDEEINQSDENSSENLEEIYRQMRSDGVISTRGLKADAEKFGELIFDVNSAYFFNHGGYEFAKQFYTDAYEAAQNRRWRAVHPFSGHARRRAQPLHVRRIGTGRVPLSSSCGLYPRGGEANSLVETL